ncbi:copper resistance protein [Rouxiella sp. Mn2063]|uniref:copper resistance protein n=1 Tax=Rouxiella sp. Mn2063 TaxID=3395262 RepID=UPI003BDD0993
MVKQQRIAKWFLFLACLVVLTCMTQRMAGFSQLQRVTGWQPVSSSVPAVELSGQDASKSSAEAQSTPCELSSKSLFSVPPILFEAALFGLALLILLLAPVILARLTLPPPRVISPTTLRVHLRLCVFRE